MAAPSSVGLPSASVATPSAPTTSAGRTSSPAHATPTGFPAGITTCDTISLKVVQQIYASFLVATPIGLGCRWSFDKSNDGMLMYVNSLTLSGLKALLKDQTGTSIHYYYDKLKAIDEQPDPSIQVLDSKAVPALGDGAYGRLASSTTGTHLTTSLSWYTHDALYSVSILNEEDGEERSIPVDEVAAFARRVAARIVVQR